MNPQLYIVKGKRQPIVRQLQAVSWAQMNDGDVFVLDSRRFVFVWMGKQSNRLERLQGAKVLWQFHSARILAVLEEDATVFKTRPFFISLTVGSKAPRRD